MTNETLGERIFYKLKEEILSGFYSPGTRLRYEEIANRLNTSITPIKEALLKLEREGLAQTIARKGTYVSTLTKADVIEYSQIRYALESLAVELFCKNRKREEDLQELQKINEEINIALVNQDSLTSVKKDIEFHQYLVALSNNERLIQTFNQLPLTNFFIMMGRQNLIVERRDSVEILHKQIIEELSQWNARKVKSLLKKNILDIYYEALEQPE